MTIYIYGLYNPLETGVYLYIGQTRNPKQRFRAHVYRVCSATKDWVGDLQKIGVPIKCRILAETDVEHSLYVESHFITKHQPKLNRILSSSFRQCSQAENLVFTERDYAFEHNPKFTHKLTFKPFNPLLRDSHHVMHSTG
jgi:hypothetical protein